MNRQGSPPLMVFAFAGIILALFTILSSITASGVDRSLHIRDFGAMFAALGWLVTAIALAICEGERQF